MKCLIEGYKNHFNYVFRYTQGKELAFQKLFLIALKIQNKV